MAKGTWPVLYFCRAMYYILSAFPAELRSSKPALLNTSSQNSPSQTRCKLIVQTKEKLASSGGTKNSETSSEKKNKKEKKKETNKQ